MRCDCCPLGAIHDEPCGLYDEHAIEDSKDGYSRCNVPWSKIQKLADEYADHLGDMGQSMGISMELERRGLEEEKLVRICKHMIGLDRAKPYYRHGRAYYKPYRNYYDAPTGGNEYLDCLGQRLAYRKATDRGVWYQLTWEGMKWLSGRIGVTIRKDDEVLPVIPVDEILY